MIILRFSNFETNTIEQHLRVLSEAGSVWWGWWKKNHEDLQAQFLRSLSKDVKHGPVGVGLVDRAEGSYFIAECVEIRFNSGDLLPCPDPGVTPSYYSGDSLVAWFRFSRIDQVSASDWVEHFGPTPEADDTLFRARRPRPAVPSELLEADAPKGATGVLHISDLHFGSDHAYVNGKSAGGPFFSESLLQKIVNSLPSSPAVVVVSGDLTTRGQEDGLRSARLFLEALAAQLNLPREAVVIAPGNHDILLDDPEVTRDFSNETPFRDTLQLFYGKPVEIERVHDVRDDRGRHYLVGVLNSSRPRARSNMDFGYVGRDRSEPVFRSLEALKKRPRQEVWTAVTLHHHVLPGQHVEQLEADRPVSLCLDAGELVSFAQHYRVGHILHGHQHLPFAASVIRRAEFTNAGAVQARGAHTHVLAAGSAGVHQSRIPGEVGLNSFSFYEPFNRKGTRVTCFAYRDVRDVHPTWTLTLDR